MYKSCVFINISSLFSMHTNPAGSDFWWVQSRIYDVFITCVLYHRDRVTHICASKIGNYFSNNGLLRFRWAFIWNNVGSNTNSANPIQIQTHFNVNADASKGVSWVWYNPILELTQRSLLILLPKNVAYSMYKTIDWLIVFSCFTSFSVEIRSRTMPMGLDQVQILKYLCPDDQTILVTYIANKVLFCMLWIIIHFQKDIC